MADMTDHDPMWDANGTIPGESSGRVKVAVEGTNGKSIVAIKQWHITHYFGKRISTGRRVIGCGVVGKVSRGDDELLRLRITTCGYSGDMIGWREGWFGL